MQLGGTNPKISETIDRIDTRSPFLPEIGTRTTDWMEAELLLPFANCVVRPSSATLPLPPESPSPPVMAVSGGAAITTDSKFVARSLYSYSVFA